jgi:large conductance mechanosensitive channel
MKKFLNEFKEFALRGNVLNLAVGVIIGAAFQNVVSALTDNILNPLIGLVAGQNFDSLVLAVIPGKLEFGYGKFLTALINFVIMAFVVFLIVRFVTGLMDKGKKGGEEEEAPETPTKECPYCLTEVNAAATRCPACTSELEAAPSEAA